MRFLPFLLLLIVFRGHAQKSDFTEKDSIFGGLTPERIWWDVRYYDLEAEVFPGEKAIRGTHTIYYTVLQPNNILQIDLQPPMEIYSISQDGEELDYEKKYLSYFIKLRQEQIPGEDRSVRIEYGGQPHVSENPPWSGGIVWAEDRHGNPFIANANQSIGASIWWPLKDHPADQPDSMQISVTVPAGLKDVSNGRLRETKKHPDGRTTFRWFVSNPVNTYGVNISIGDYEHFSEVFQGEDGPLDCDYYVLKGNKSKAKEHFKDVPRMLEAFEHWFGPYPFYEDGYKLVEVPYLGMEHQSCVTYGNQFLKGYLGRDVSHTGWGMKFDFIIVHESAHEWWANSVTNADVADMWIHESFTSYAESLFVEYFYGKEAGAEYVRGVRANIHNDGPLQGKYGVRNEGSADMYYKGSNIWHTLRQIVDNDDKWRQILRGIQRKFRHQTVTAADIENYLNTQIETDLLPFFDQYLRDSRMPVLSYRVEKGSLKYRFDNVIEGFSMPVKIRIGGDTRWLGDASDQWNQITLPTGSELSDIEADPDFYIACFPMTEVD